MASSTTIDCESVPWPGQCRQPRDKVRELQRTLYRAAKADPKRRFHALYDKIYRSDVMERAWDQVRRKRGAAGIDRIKMVAYLSADNLGLIKLDGSVIAPWPNRPWRVKPNATGEGRR
jgi:RNA-directed DNA polymerase